MLLARPQLLLDFIGGLTFLIELKIQNVGLMELHPLIGVLVNLKLLHLRGCRHLEYLPQSVGKLQALVELDLFCSGIKELPDTIGNLKSLKAIDVSWTALERFPKALVKLENLERLVIHGCEKMDINSLEKIGKLSCFRTLRVVKAKITTVPTTINQFSLLQQLELSGIHESQGLLNLPMGLTRLDIECGSLKPHQVPDLSYMTNLVELSFWCGYSTDPPRTSSTSVQTPQLKWLEGLPKLERLVLDFPDLISTPIEFSSLPRLRLLEITCYNPRSLTQMPSSLEYLGLVDAKSPIDWQHLSSLNNLSRLKIRRCWLKEIKVDCLGQLYWLTLQMCRFLERLSNLSSLKKLTVLRFLDCQHLVDIEGLGELKSLKTLTFVECDSIQRLPDLSRLKKLESLSFYSCKSLESTPEVHEEAPCRLELCDCKHFRNYGGPYSEWHRGH